MLLDDAARARIAPFVSSLDGEVFALAGLPAETIALLFAEHARSRAALRPLLAALLATTSAAPVSTRISTPSALSPALRDALTSYGHPSIAEHVPVTLGIEGVSILAAKAIEDSRLGSFVEKSTRHAAFDGQGAVVPPGIAADPASAADYRAITDRLLRTHADLLPKVVAALRAQSSRPGGASDPAHEAALRGRAGDLLRGLLPAGARTSLGLTANARALALHLGKLLGHPLAEVRDLAGAMLTAARAVSPTLFEAVGPDAYRAGLAARVAEPLRMLYSPPDPRGNTTMVVTQPVRLLRHDKDALERVALALAYEDSDGRAHAHGLADALRLGTAAELTGLVKSALTGRPPGAAAPRAFEATSLTFELMLDYGAYRDLQRHRLVSRASQRLGCRVGFDTPTELLDLGLADPYQDALISAYEPWQRLEARDPHEAQYAVPLGYKLRTLITLDLRELFHVIELRSARGSHPSTRRIAQGLYRSVGQVLPWLKDMILVDLADNRTS
ncbi:MAG: FAD-dependent thymidylate synthase [Byssovorax sp.]